MEADLYAALGVAPSASADDLKDAYRRLALEYHPDKAGDDVSGAFTLLQHAWEILRDPQRREEYDAQRSLDTSSIEKSFNHSKHVSGTITEEDLDFEEEHCDGSEAATFRCRCGDIIPIDAKDLSKRKAKGLECMVSCASCSLRYGVDLSASDRSSS